MYLYINIHKKVSYIKYFYMDSKWLLLLFLPHSLL